MKKKLYGFTIVISLFCLYIASCTVIGENPKTLTPKIYSTTMPTTFPTHTTTPSLTEIANPVPTLSPFPDELVLPEITMSPQEAKNALAELLRTNGNCTGKCIAGIRPDDMTMQDAVDKMAQWGTVHISKNSQGKTFVSLDQSPLYKQISVYLSLGPLTKKSGIIETVGIRIDAAPGSGEYAGADFWQANRDALRGFRVDSLVKAYGIPSYVGYDFSLNYNPPSPRKERSFAYGISMQYEQLNLQVFIGALAYYDGEKFFLCPSKDPHSVRIEINPETPLKELEGIYSVTWESLTNTDLNTFYQTVTNGTNPDACITTTDEQILTLHPSFR